MAFSTQPLFNHTHYSPPLHQLKKNKPVIPLFSDAHFTPPPLRSPCFRAKFGTFTNPSSSKQLRFSVKANNHFSFCFFTFWVYVLWDSFCIVWLFFCFCRLGLRMTILQEMRRSLLFLRHLHRRIILWFL